MSFSVRVLIVLGRSIDAERAEAEVRRPLRDLLLLMPHLQVGTESDIDYEGAEPALLHQIGANAEVTMRTIHRGTAAIGRLLVLASPEIGMGELSADTIEAIGETLTEMADLAATVHIIAASCQRFTSDYSPGTPKHIPNARP